MEDNGRETPRLPQAHQAGAEGQPTWGCHQQAMHPYRGPELQKNTASTPCSGSTLLSSKNTQGPNSCCSRLYVLTPSEADKGPRVYIFQNTNHPFTKGQQSQKL